MQAGMIGLGRMGGNMARRLGPRVVWMMVPAGSATEENIRSLAQQLAPGDIVVDGGNAHYRDSERRGLSSTA